MFRKSPVAAAFALALTSPLAIAADPVSLDEIRQEIRQLKDAYEARIRALEDRLKSAEESAAKTQAAAPAPAPVSAPVTAEAPAPQPAAPPVQTQSNAFNPAISLILNGTWGRYGRDPSTQITGFSPSGGEVSPARGASLGESELFLSANIDPMFRGALLVAITPEGTAEVEESFFETLAIGHGVTVKGGRFFSGIGYQNALHPHAWDFADASLVQRAFLGNNYGDDGVQLRYVAPLPVLVQIGTEIGRGREFAGAGEFERSPQRNGKDSQTFFAKVGDDIGTSHSYQLGVSHLRQRSGAQGVSMFDYDDISGVTNLFGGRQRISGVDFVYKWAPEGNPRYENFKFAAEWFQRKLDGDFAFDTAGINSLAPLAAKQSGWYAQAVYQFHPYWRVGGRVDRLSSGSVSLDANAANLAVPGFDPKRSSLMIDWNPSEFSRVRLQFNRDASRQDLATGEVLKDNQLFLQYIHSLGTHGAHRF